MTGKELFDYHQLAALKAGFGSEACCYGNILFEALRIEGEEIVFRKLEEANDRGKRIGLGFSNPERKDTDPDQVLII